MGSVNLKGTGSGIILDLNDSVSFEELKMDLMSKFRESSSFLGKVNVGLLLRGREVSEEELDQILQIISDNSKIHVNCVLRQDAKTDEIFARYQEQIASGAVEPEKQTMDQGLDSDFEQLAVENPVVEIPEDIYDNHAKIIHGNLRSGQEISEKESILIMGDIKPGASVTSDGSIFVLGSLRGSVYAGAGGDESAYVFALEMDPLQIRIANAIAISPDADVGPKLKTRRFRKKNVDKTPEVAYIFNGHVVKDVYSTSFKRVHK